MARVNLASWGRVHCPFCAAWEPEFAVIMPSGDRQLICGRCSASWPFCGIHVPLLRERRTRARDIVCHSRRPDRVYGCDACHRYLKVYDARNATRSVMIAVDSIATLPLDAAAMQRGYA